MLRLYLETAKKIDNISVLLWMFSPSGLLKQFGESQD